MSVTTGNVTEHIDASLEETGKGAVAGQVTNASNGQGAAGVSVFVRSEANHCTETNGNGEYAISGHSVGSYTIPSSLRRRAKKNREKKSAASRSPTS